ncbi:mandelate racemase/muconate lactonizing enzyme family protein [Salinicoccus sp. Marseille-QA3877]
MKDVIKEVKARTIIVPLDKPVKLGGSSVTERDYCFIEIITSEGSIGYALTFSRGGDLTSTVIKNIAPILIGQSIDQVEKIWEEVYIKNRLNGQQGLFMRALSIVDLAIWDIKSKKAQLPLYKMIGGYRDSIPVLMAGGYYGTDKNLNELLEEYEGYVKDGYKHLKLMVGGASMEEDRERFIMLRKNLPSDITLAVDANGSWDDPKAVLRWINLIEEKNYEISFLEEPFPPENIEWYTWLRNQTTVKIAVGEFMAGRWSFKNAISRGYMDIVRADATLCGGITEWKRIAAMASSWGLQMIPHYFAPIHLHTALAFPNSNMVEVVSQQNKNSSFSLLVGENYEFREGVAYPKDFLGLGLIPNREFMDSHTIDIQSYNA